MPKTMQPKNLKRFECCRCSFPGAARSLNAINKRRCGGCGWTYTWREIKPNNPPLDRDALMVKEYGMETGTGEAQGIVFICGHCGYKKSARNLESARRKWCPICEMQNQWRYYGEGAVDDPDEFPEQAAMSGPDHFGDAEVDAEAERIIQNQPWAINEATRGIDALTAPDHIADASNMIEPNHPPDAGEMVLPEAIRVLLDRDKIGRKTYGQSLTTHNGRDALQDAIEEIADALKYLVQMKMERDRGKQAGQEAISTPPSAIGDGETTV